MEDSGDSAGPFWTSKEGETDDSVNLSYDYSEESADGFAWRSSAFCADPFWVGNSSSTAFPSVTGCFQHSILDQLAPLLMLLSIPIICIKLQSARREAIESEDGKEERMGREKRIGKLAFAQNVLTVLAAASRLFLLLRAIYVSVWLGERLPLVELLYPVTHLTTLLLILYYSEQFRLLSRPVPGPIFCVWLLFFLGGVPEFLELLFGRTISNANTLTLLTRADRLLWWPLCCVQLVLNCFSTIPQPIDEQERNCSPEERASFFSSQFFGWFDPLVRTGHRRPIDETDVFRLVPSKRAKRLFKRWCRERENQMNESIADVSSPQNGQLKGDGLVKKRKEQNERTPLLLLQSSVKQMEKQKKFSKAPPSIVACLWRLFKWEISGAMLAKMLSDFLQVATPLLLGQLIAFTENPKLPAWNGFFLAGCLFLTSEIRSLLQNNYFTAMNSVGCQVQSVLTSAVYAKTLRLSSTARRGRTSGEIVNLMAIDVDRFQQVTPLLQQIWSSPLQVVLCLTLLYRTIGWSVAGGVLFMLALIPCNLAVVRFTRRWQLEQMVFKDARLRMISEVLTGIRAVKLYAWEEPMRRAIEEIRQKEVQLIRRAALFRITSDVLNLSSPFFVAIITFALYIFSDPERHLLTPEVAFVSLTLFSQLRIPMMVLAELIGQLVQTAVSNRRLKNFLVADEIAQDAIERDLDPQYERAIDVEFASFDWKRSTRPAKKHSLLPTGHAHLVRPGGMASICEPYTLNNLELHLRRGLLVSVVGRVGAGKSSLLNALLGEMHKAYGYVGLRGRVAYVPQQPWVLNRTVRRNILFSLEEEGLQPNEELYARVVDACALEADFSVLPQGDQTEIGERGINLSGGQKARVNLARALYRQADIYLLDDPLSAVDAIVGRHLFDKAVGPESLTKGSTRVLVTHSLAYLAESDWIIAMEGGQVIGQGTYEELLREPETAQLIARLGEEEEKAKARREKEEKEEGGGGEGEGGELEEASEVETGAEERDDHDEPSTESSSFHAGDVTDTTLTLGTMSALSTSSLAKTLRRRTQSSRSSIKTAETRVSVASRKTKAVAEGKMSTAGKLIEKEETEAGRVQPSIYRDYFAAMRWPLFIGFVVFLFVQFVLNVTQNLWLSGWSDDNSQLNSAQPKTSTAIRFSIYAIQGLGIAISLALANILQVLGSISASIRLHGPLLDRVLHAPISFFDTTPLGRVLNRFGKEFDVVDLRLAGAFRILAFSFLMVLQVFLLISLSMPIFTLLLLPTVLLYGIILRYFIPTSRQLQRLASVTRSPLYNLFAETINGTTSIRAYGVSQSFFDNFCNKLDVQIGCRYFALLSNRWLSVRLELIGNFVILFCSVMAVFSRDWGTVTAGLIGLSVSKSLDITFILGFLVRNINDAEMSIVSVERILEYRTFPQEAAWESPVGRGPPEGWPSRGAVQFIQYSCRYRKELALSLRRITAEIGAGEKVGIVGRTGAGKTSLVLALFRIIEAAEGRILIDGVNIAKVGVQELRSKITIIPQDPVLFSGSLRFNLDPFDMYNDDRLWMALEQVHLRQFVEAQPKKLFHEIAEGGENISVGQRQLLCMARAILRRSPLIVLDEATASIDAQTDALIQRTIRSEFSQSTIMTIAHRISTVMDYDRIMVLVGGRLVEFDTPAKLMADKNSHFRELVEQQS